MSTESDTENDTGVAILLSILYRTIIRFIFQLIVKLLEAHIDIASSRSLLFLSITKLSFCSSKIIRRLTIWGNYQHSFVDLFFSHYYIIIDHSKPLVRDILLFCFYALPANFINPNVYILRNNQLIWEWHCLFLLLSYSSEYNIILANVALVFLLLYRYQWFSKKNCNPSELKRITLSYFKNI